MILFRCPRTDVVANFVRRHPGVAAAAVIAAAAVLMAGCAGREVLVKRSPVVPAGVDFSGSWQLANDSADTNRRLGEAQVRAAGGRGNVLAPRGAEAARRDRSSLVHVFLETGSNLKITQTAHALFISFDRAIVEEYRFGEHTEVRVGPVVADRSSGWEERAYVIETLGEKGDKLYERYRLAEDGARLVREISIFTRKSPALSIVQQFDCTAD